MQHPMTLAKVRADGVAGHVGVIVPGGHAPWQDLATNADLGAVLSAFHAASKPTALICHGPAALLSTLPDASAFEVAMVKGDAAAAQKLAANWPYAGYHMTAFSTSEERFVEPRLLQGQVRFYLAEALAQAGGRVEAQRSRPLGFRLEDAQSCSEHLQDLLRRSSTRCRSLVGRDPLIEWPDL